MDQSKRDHIDQKIRALLNKQQLLKRLTMQFVLSASAFSILILWYSSGFSIHPQSFNAYFSTYLFTLFTHTLERKYMFLICNGILAFIAKNSIMSRSSSPPPTISDSDHFELHASNDYMNTIMSMSMSMSSSPPTISDSDHFELLASNDDMNTMVVVPLEKVPLVAEEQEELYREQVSEAEEQKEEEEDTLLYTQNEAYMQEEEEKEEVIKLKSMDEGGAESEVEVKVAQDDHEDEDEDEVAETTSTTKEELANTEELNRKFEEFIRKMKEEMRIEAQRHLIAV